MPTKSKETLTAEKSSTASTAKKTKEKTAKTTTTTRKSTGQRSPKKQTVAKQKTEPTSQTTAVQEELIVTATPDAVAAQSSDGLPTVPAEVSPQSANEQSANEQTADENINESTITTEIPVAGIEVGNGLSFRASELVSGKIWAPNTAIPELDEATYAAQKAQAEAQRRAIEVARLNLKNINDMHQLEQESINAAISAKANETKNAQLTSAEIDYQTQLEENGERSQRLAQAASRHQAATRETGYTDQLIALKDQNAELDIQQAQNIFAEKAARYRAQLTGQ